MSVSWPVTPEEAIELLRKHLLYNYQKEGTSMAVRQRIVIDFPVDPNTASPRAMTAIANEMKDYTQVVLIKDKEILLEDHAEVVSVHIHDSTSSYACEDCINLAEDERNGG